MTCRRPIRSLSGNFRISCPVALGAFFVLTFTGPESVLSLPASQTGDAGSSEIRSNAETSSRQNSANDVSALRQQAHEAMTRGDFETAQQIYASLLEREPRDLDALWKLSFVYEETGKIAYAHSLLLRAVQVAPDEPRVKDRLRSLEAALRDDLKMEIARLEAEGRAAETIPHYKQLIALSDDNPEAHYRLGKALALMGESAQAAAAFENALRLEPENETYILAKNEEVHKVRADEVKIIQQQAKILYAKGEVHKARPLLDEILRIDPDNRWAKEAIVQESSLTPAADTSAVGQSESGIELPALTPIFKAMGRFLLRVGKVAIRPFYEPIFYAAIGLVCLIYFTLRLPKAMVQSGRRGILAGSVRQFHLRDVFNFLHDLDKSGTVVAYRRGRKAQVVFEKGEIVSASTGKSDGPEAVKELLDWTQGTFYVKKGNKVYRRNVDQPFTILLMDEPDLTMESILHPDEEEKPKSKMMELLEGNPLDF